MSYPLKSFAKINLYLHITGKEKVFHQLDTFMLLLGLYDEITMEKSPQNNVIVTSKFKEFIPQEDNIITKILNTITNDFNIKDKYTVHLKKNIPISAGLGGGSSNGAKVLQFLNNHYHLNLSKEYLKNIAYTIGADIPFFFYCGKNSPELTLNNTSTHGDNNKPIMENNAGNNNQSGNVNNGNTTPTGALVQGIGEKITPKNLMSGENYYILVFNPLFPVSTSRVFAKFTMVKSEKKNFVPNNIEDIIKHGKNDLEQTIIKLYPQLEEYLNTLRQTNPQYSQISGTGATIFALYKSQEALQQAIAKMQKSFANGWLYSQELIAIE